MFFRINSQSDMCCGDKWVAWNKKNGFAFFGSFNDDHAVFFLKFTSGNHMDFFAAQDLKTLQAEFGH